MGVIWAGDTEVFSGDVSCEQGFFFEIFVLLLILLRGGALAGMGASINIRHRSSFDLQNIPQIDTFLSNHLLTIFGGCG